MTVVSATLIQCVSPGGRANRDSDIEVINFDGQSVEVEDALRFLDNVNEFLRGDADGDGQIEGVTDLSVGANGVLNTGFGKGKLPLELKLGEAHSP